MSNPIYALILAGGSGERFWPLSRRARPKQLLRLVAEETLLEQTVSRLEGLVPAERILILTNVEQEAAVRELLPKLARENILAEPAKRDTAAAVALGAGWVAVRDHSATMIVLPADHVIKDTAAFQKTLAAAAAAAEEKGALVTIDRAYDLLESIIPTPWQAEIAQVAGRYGDHSTEGAVAKVLALCADVRALRELRPRVVCL